jgi:hypothetical protein
MAKANDVQTITLRGKLSFAKVLEHQLSLNYNKDGREWKVDLEITPDDAKGLKSVGIADRVKTKDEYLSGNPFLSFKQAELKKDGSPNETIKVTDILGKPWDQEKELGNGTVADLKFVVVDYGKGMKKGVYIRAIRVLEHVPYESKPFTALDESDPYFAAAQAAAAQGTQTQEQDEDLNDEIPF